MSVNSFSFFTRKMVVDPNFNDLNPNSENNADDLDMQKSIAASLDDVLDVAKTHPSESSTPPSTLSFDPEAAVKAIADVYRRAVADDEDSDDDGDYVSDDDDFDCDGLREFMFVQMHGQEAYDAWTYG